MDEYEEHLQAVMWYKAGADNGEWKTPTGKTPTKAKTDKFKEIIEIYGQSMPVMPKPTAYKWVDQCRISAEVAMRSPWLMDIVNHPDTRFQESIVFEWEGVLFKMRVDLINPTLQIIIDFKTVGFKLDKNEWKIVKNRNVRINFVENMNYLLQGAIYCEGASAKYGFNFDYYIACVEKTDSPRFEILHIPDEDMNISREVVFEKSYLFARMIAGEIKPFKCMKHDCNYCAPLRKVTEPINWRQI